jgi:hydrogenase nickel incorporation protein HypA/HybF
MHGLPAAVEIVEAVTQTLGEKPDKVREIKIEMGPNSSIDAEELKLCYEIASRGTLVEGSKLDISLRPGLIECLECGFKEEKNRVDRLPTCSSCASTRIRINGVGIVLKKIFFEGEL